METLAYIGLLLLALVILAFALLMLGVAIEYGRRESLARAARRSRQSATAAHH
jgi:hypothetical protein